MALKKVPSLDSSGKIFNKHVPDRLQDPALQAAFRRKDAVEVSSRDFNDIKVNDQGYDSGPGINRMLAEARAAQGEAVFYEQGNYFSATTIDLNSANAATPVVLRGASARGTSLGPKPTRIVRPTGSTQTLVRMLGHGASLIGITLDGQNTLGTLLRTDRGFESVVKDVILYRAQGHGWDAAALSNAHIENVTVSQCGSPIASGDKAAVRIRGNNQYEYVSNSTHINGLRIERCPGVALDLAYGGNPDDRLEFLWMYGLHIEGVIDSTPYTSFPVDPLLRIGNVRGVNAYGSYLYGGKGPLIRYDQQQAVGGSAYGGITFHGGTLYGFIDNDVITANTPDRLVDLVRGDNFIMDGVTFDSALVEHIRVRDTFGKKAWILNPLHKTRAGATTTYVTDDRADTRSTRTPATAPVVVRAQDTSVNSGTPTVTGRGVAAFDAASEEVVTAFVNLPEAWSACRVKVVWSNEGTGTGAVTWRLDYGSCEDGGNTNTLTAGVETTGTAAGQYVAVHTPLQRIDLASSSMLSLKLRRRAAVAADTLANDAGLISLVFTEA